VSNKSEIGYCIKRHVFLLEIRKKIIKKNFKMQKFLEIIIFICLIQHAALTTTKKLASASTTKAVRSLEKIVLVDKLVESLNTQQVAPVKNTNICVWKICSKPLKGDAKTKPGLLRNFFDSIGQIAIF